MKYILSIAFVAFFMVLGQAQNEVVKWTAELVHQEGNYYEVVLTADIEEKWSLYSQFLDEGGPIPTTIELNESSSYVIEGKVKENDMNSVETMDDMFGMKLKKFKTKAVFTQTISSSDDLKDVSGTIEFMTCDDSKCLPPQTIEFTALRRQ
jgi:thiol:disulfide interchange protein DsbD